MLRPSVCLAAARHGSRLLSLGFKLMPVAAMAGPMLRTVAGAPAGILCVPRTSHRSHCAVAQVLVHLVGVLIVCFMDFVGVAVVLVYDFAVAGVMFFASLRFSRASLVSLTSRATST